MAYLFYSHNIKALRETQTLHAGCSKDEPKIFALLQTPFAEVRDGQNLISWRRLPTNPVWWGSIHAISSYHGNRPPHTNKQPQTRRQDRLQYTVLQPARSVNKFYHLFIKEVDDVFRCDSDASVLQLRNELVDLQRLLQKRSTKFQELVNWCLTALSAQPGCIVP